jgi:hypothetical protein
MIKYATAIKTGTASTEAILRRFTEANVASAQTRDAGGEPPTTRSPGFAVGPCTLASETAYPRSRAPG